MACTSFPCFRDVRKALTIVRLRFFVPTWLQSCLHSYPLSHLANRYSLGDLPDRVSLRLLAFSLASFSSPWLFLPPLSLLLVLGLGRHRRAASLDSLPAPRSASPAKHSRPRSAGAYTRVCYWACEIERCWVKVVSALVLHIPYHDSTRQDRWSSRAPYCTPLTDIPVGAPLRSGSRSH